LQLFGVLAFIMNLTSCAQTSENKTQLKTIEGWETLTENNYSINYPDNWEINKSGQMGAKFILFSPLSSEEDQFKENVNFLVQDLTGHNLNLDQYVEIKEETNAETKEWSFISNLSKGMYLIIISNNGIRRTTRFIKE
jgi:hypothetical protein